MNTGFGSNNRPLSYCTTKESCLSCILCICLQKNIPLSGVVQAMSAVFEQTFDRFLQNVQKYRSMGFRFIYRIAERSNSENDATNEM